MSIYLSKIILKNLNICTFSTICIRKYWESQNRDNNHIFLKNRAPRPPTYRVVPDDGVAGGEDDGEHHEDAQVDYA